MNQLRQVGRDQAVLEVLLGADFRPAERGLSEKGEAAAPHDGSPPAAV